MELNNIIEFPKIEKEVDKIKRLNELSSKLEEAEYNLKIAQQKILEQLIKKVEIKL